MIELANGCYSKSDVSVGQAGVGTHSLMALLIGTAERTKSRRRLYGQWKQEVAFNSDSEEVLTPIWKDPLSFIPLAIIIGRLLINPKCHQVGW